MKTSAKITVQAIVQELFLLGLEHVVISPGSRSAPIVIALNVFPEIKKYVILDERSAAFFALGLATESKKTVALLCTSGSASVNYFPAITEAFYQGISLLAITADRPLNLINQGDGQTIMQDNVFGKHVRLAASISDSDSIDLVKDAVNSIFKASFYPGPSHLNVHLSEPLYDQVEFLTKEISREKTYDLPTFEISNILELQEKWNNAQSKMIVIGQLQPCRETEALLLELSADSSVAILCENISNQTEWKFNTSIDRAFSQMENQKDFVPDLLLVLGSSFVSKNLKNFLRNNQIETTVIVDTLLDNANTFSCKNPYFIKSTTLFFLQSFQIDAEAMNASNFGAKWKQLDYIGQAKQESVLVQLPFCDLKIMERLISNLPDVATLHLGNSSIIRYAQQFTSIKNLKYRSNRGVAGIDGSLSTAVGAAAFEPQKLHVIVLGDLSFFYDSNAFLNNYLSSNLRIIVINNGGGSIFGMISGPKNINDFDTFFRTKQSASIEKLCQAHAIYYKKAIRIEDLDPAFENLFSEESDAPILLEIDSSNCNNELIFEQYKQQMTI